MPLALNFLLFQLGWFACVLGGAHQLPWFGVGVAGAIVLLHLRLAAEPRRELALIAAAGALGAVWDSALVATGLLAYPSGLLHPSLAPVWIIAMWMLFATTPNLSLRWLKGRPWLAAACGAVAGPLAYLGGEALGGVRFNAPAAGLAALALGWSLLLPLLMGAAVRLNGFAPLHPRPGDA